MRCETIGDATLHLGDCRDILPALPGASIDLLWTDPPYGNSNHAGDLNAWLNDARGLESIPIANDGQESMREVVDFALVQAARLLKPDRSSVCVCCCAGGPRPTFAWLANRMDSEGLQFFHSVIWDKANPGLGWRYRRQHELVMIAHRVKGKIGWADMERAVPDIFRFCPAREREHPNEKPLPLVDWFVANHTVGGDTILDPFMGSGTTGVSCANQGRRFIGVELDMVHFDTACRRIEAAYRQPRLFVDAPAQPVQENFLELFA